MTGCPAGPDRTSSRRPVGFLVAVLALAAVIWLGVAGAAAAQQVVINSPGPMTQITLGDDLTCQVQMANDTTGVFYNGGVPGACGTFLQVNAVTQLQLPNELFGPTVPAGSAQVSADFVPVSQTPVTGSGTGGSPYTIVTTAQACAGGSCTRGALIATLTETDTYVVGSDEYKSSLVIQDNIAPPLTGTLYHAADCYLQGDQGYGALGAGNAPECTLTPNNSPPGRVVSLLPGPSPSSAYYEGGFDSFWTAITPSGIPYPDTVDAPTFEDNGLGLSWPYSVTFGTPITISYDTLVSPAQAVANAAPPVVSGTPALGQTLSCSPGSWSGSGPITYAYQWLQDGNLIAGATNSAYTVQSGDQGHSLACQVTAGNGIGNATQTSAPFNIAAVVPAVSPQPPTVNGAHGATFTAAVDPEGSPTTVHFEYGLDPQYGLTTVSNLYVQQTADQGLSSVSGSQSVSAPVTGLVPHARYHLRVVATNQAGTVTGHDQVFTTAAIPPPPAPVLGHQANFAPTSGVVYVKPPASGHIAALAAVVPLAKTRTARGRGFIPLTEALQLPVGTQVDARNGTLKVTTASTAAKPGQRTQTQSGQFSRGLFEVLQGARRGLKGLTILKLLDSGVFPGAPSYRTECATGGKTIRRTGKPGPVLVFRHRRLSHRVLQTLLAGEHGSYQTQGRYSAATVRGTVYAVTDRCDGTLTHVVQGAVVVNDYRRHRNVVLRSGHQYLAQAP